MTDSAPRRYQRTVPPIPDAEKVIKVPIAGMIAPFTSTLTSAQQAQLQREFQTHWQQDRAPVTVFNQMIDRLAELTLPHLDRAAARQHIGYEITRAGPTATLMGRILMAPLRLMGPSRFLQYFPTSFATISNYGSWATWEVAPQHWHMEAEDQLLYLDYLQGVGQAYGVELLKVPGWTVASTALATHHYLFTVTW